MRTAEFWKDRKKERAKRAIRYGTEYCPSCELGKGKVRRDGTFVKCPRCGYSEESEDE